MEIKVLLAEEENYIDKITHFFWDNIDKITLFFEGLIRLHFAPANIKWAQKCGWTRPNFFLSRTRPSSGPQ